MAHGFERDAPHRLAVLRRPGCVAAPDGDAPVVLHGEDAADVVHAAFDADMRWPSAVQPDLGIGSEPEQRGRLSRVIHLPRAQQQSFGFDALHDKAFQRNDVVRHILSIYRPYQQENPTTNNTRSAKPHKTTTARISRNTQETETIQTTPKRHQYNDKTKQHTTTAHPPQPIPTQPSPKQNQHKGPHTT